MKKNVTAIILISITVIALSVSAFVFIPQTTKIENISNTQNKKIKILIVPGHEPNTGGASYKNINERDLNVQLANLIRDELASSSNIEIIIARDTKDWNSDLKNYVITNATKIMSWVASMKKEMLTKAKLGEIKIIKPNIVHNDATSEAVLYLYGTNKWIADNKIDLVLHVHFNNNPKINSKPNYSGYCIYVPDSQYGNASSSLAFANYINKEISKIENKSNFLLEKNTVITDQELIAIGSYNTLKIPSAVVEYAYIYEPMMVSSSTRNKFIEKAASSTATAIENYIKNNF